MFPSVNPKQSFPNLEADITQFWKDNGTFKKSVNQRPVENPYRFYDGPPFITGTPHYGSLLSSIVKDTVGRYWTMQGKRVERVWGWDCHGLPIEEKVQKKLGINSNKEVEQIGVKKFIDECYAYTAETSAEWDWYIDRIGRWVDMDRAYRTMDQDYMESVMWVFSELYRKGLVYEGKRVSLYSWKLGTPISNFEVAMDDSYQEVNDPAITVKFKIATEGDLKDVNILAWTTTPWTIPANMALAVRNDIDYVLVSQHDEAYIVAKNRLETVFKGKGEYTLLREFKGTELVGLSYIPPFPEYYYQKFGDKNHKVYHADFITDTDGTGIGHEAPEFGDVDYQLAKEHGIHISNAMDEEGRYTNEIFDYVGTHYLDLDHPEKGANKINIERMKANNSLFKLEGITHRVPFCPRSGTPLMQKAQKSWFIDIQNNKEALKNANEEIYWFPEHLKHGRFAKGLDSAPDWCISRTRYWGAPMPVWIGRDAQGTEKDRKVFASRAEIEAESGMKIVNLHKPYIDDITWTANGLTYTRIPEVLDVWMDSGSMPYAQMHYPFDNQEAMEASFPADFIAEYVGQVRAWFYVMHVLGVLLKGKPAFKNVITTGVIYGTDGRKMSKSFKNYPDPRGTIEQYGADAIRFYLTNTPLMTGGDIDFSEDGIVDAIKRVILPLWNTYSFFTTYANIDGWKPAAGRHYFMRHGETDANLEKRLSDGLDDTPLNANGQAQALKSAETMKARGMKFDIIFVSPLARAQETAKIVADTTGFTGEMITVPDLMERRSAKFTGRKYTEVIEEHNLATGESCDMSDVHAICFADNSIESEEQFTARVQAWVETELPKHAEKNVLIVAHGGVFKSVFQYMESVPASVAFDRHLFSTMKNAEYVELPHTPRVNPMDRWIIGELQELNAKVQNSYEKYDLQTMARSILDFMDDLTNWYVRRSRRRFWRSEADTDKNSAYETLHRVLVEFCQIAAPIIPFVTEHIYQGLTGRESVHLEFFPEFNRFSVPRDLRDDMKKTKQFVALGLALRGRKKLRVRQPLQSVTIGTHLSEYYVEILREELNVKEIIMGADMSKVAKLICRPNARLIGPRFGKNVQQILGAAKSGDFTELADGRVQVGEAILEAGEFELVYEPLELDMDVEGGGGLVLLMDTVVTETLKQEGMARDLVRSIQDLRKEAGYEVSDRIHLGLQGASEMLAFREYIQSETLAQDISESDLEGGVDISRTLEIEGQSITIALKKI